MKIKQFAVTIALGATALSSTATPLTAAQLSNKKKQFLAAYEKVHHALVADDLVKAKAAAKDLGPEGADVAYASSLKGARAGFEKLSTEAKTLTAGQSGYHVFHCPMVKKDWVQTTERVENPYGGKEMASCGELKK